MSELAKLTPAELMYRAEVFRRGIEQFHTAIARIEAGTHAELLEFNNLTPTEVIERFNQMIAEGEQELAKTLNILDRYKN